MLALTSVVLATACSSSYTPQSRGRVSIMMKDGAITYVRDGKNYEHGLLGGGLRDAVAGNPYAERAADEYTGRMKTGLVGVLAGAACSIGATVYGLRKLEDEGSSDSAERTLWLVLGCTAVMLGGSLYMVSAEPYRWDAINLFNDAPPAPQYPPGPPAWSARKSHTLQMRD
jgi:hypothetical protein